MTHAPSLVGITLALGLLLSCRAADVAEAEPAWLPAYVDARLAEPVSSPPGQVFRFVWRGQAVYYAPAYCCDIPSELRDASGAILCLPDGGFTGEGDGRCPAFASERSECELVWRDPRAKPGSTPDCADLRGGAGGVTE